MAGLRGNQAWLMAMKQSGKLGSGAAPVPAEGTPPTAFKMPFSGGSIGPSRATDRLAETDASRDAGDLYVTSTGVEGSPEFYVRDESIPFWLWAAMGNVASTGADPNYTHTLTPGNVLPYITVWKDIADVLYEEYKDCKVGSLAISAEAGAPLAATATIMGLQTTRLTAAPDDALPVAVQDGVVYNYNQASVTLGGGATALVRSFSLTIENNLTSQQTDNVVPYDVSEGQREVTLGFDLIFESLDEYNKFYYGGAAGTEISDQIFTTDATFTFTLGANNEIAFNLPRIAYQEFPVEPNTSGDPIVSSITAVAMRNTPILTATVKNQVPSY